MDEEGDEMGRALDRSARPPQLFGSDNRQTVRKAGPGSRTSFTLPEKNSACRARMGSPSRVSMPIIWLCEFVSDTHVGLVGRGDWTGGWMDGLNVSGASPRSITHAIQDSTRPYQSRTGGAGGRDVHVGPERHEEGRRWQGRRRRWRGRCHGGEDCGL